MLAATCGRPRADATWTRALFVLGDGNDSLSMLGPFVPRRAPAGASLTTFIDAGRGDDSIRGSAVTDVIAGGPGINTVRAGAGNDQVEMRNDVRDAVIDCGDGDVAIIDRIDPQPVGCERSARG